MDVKNYIEEVRAKLKTMSYEQIEQKLKEVGITKIEVLERSSFILPKEFEYCVNENSYTIRDSKFTQVDDINKLGVAA